MCVCVDKFKKFLSQSMWAMEDNGQVDSEVKWTKKKIFICFYENFGERISSNGIKFDNYRGQIFPEAKISKEISKGITYFFSIEENRFDGYSRWGGGGEGATVKFTFRV